MRVVAISQRAGAGDVAGAVSLGSLASTTDSTAAITSALTTLLANERDVFIPRGTWQVNPSAPFTLRAGQRVYGVGGGIHNDPGATAVSRLTVPAGFTGIDLFKIPAGVPHGRLHDFAVDLTNAAVGNTGRVFYWENVGTAEESQWQVDRVQVKGPFGSAFKTDTGRRGNQFTYCGAFRNGGTSMDTCMDVRGTDAFIVNCILGAATANIGTAIKLYGSNAILLGGAIFGTGTGIDTATGGDGIYIGGGVGIDLMSGVSIILNDGSGGVIDGIKLHSGSQLTDATKPFIETYDTHGGWSIGNVNLYQGSGITNAATYFIESKTGGGAAVEWPSISNRQGIGTGTKPVRTNLSVGIDTGAIRGALLTTGQAVPERRPAASAAMTSQVLRGTFFRSAKSQTVTNIATGTSGAGAAGATPTICRYGLYSVDPLTGAGTLIGSTTNDTTLWAANTTRYSKALTAAVDIYGGNLYCVAALCVTGATAPTIAATTASNLPLADLALDERIAFSLTAQSDLPSSFTLAGTTTSQTIPYFELT